MSARRWWGRPLTPLYGLGLVVAEKLRNDPKQLTWPVVSVGSVSAGGAGKTPVVITLARLLKDTGWAVNVLSRGYGRSGWAAEVVTNREDAATWYGDEPTLIATKAAVPVWVGAERYEAGRLAEAVATEDIWHLDEESMKPGNGPAYVDLEPQPPVRGLHLLDDGFQHRQLARTVDIVLITAEDLDDALIPAGNLREPLTALTRADIVIVREDEVETLAKRIWPLLRERAQMWVVRRRLRFPPPLFVFGAGLRPVAFCGLARPEGFAAMLAEAGCGVVETVAFQDHHRYTTADIARVLEVAKALNATGFVTTEKDAVKLSPAMRAQLEQLGPLMIVALEAEFDDPTAVLRALEAALTAAGEGATA
jgi:tetraacyldisaccharide 4'-kinase